MISASADVFGTDNDFDCFIEIDGVEIVASNRTSMIGTDKHRGELLDGRRFYEITAGGTYAVDFAFNNVDASTRVDEAVLNVLYVSVRSRRQPHPAKRSDRRRTQSGLALAPLSTVEEPVERLQILLFPRSPMVSGLSQTRSSATA